MPLQVLSPGAHEGHVQHVGLPRGYASRNKQLAVDSSSSPNSFEYLRVICTLVHIFLQCSPPPRRFKPLKNRLWVVPTGCRTIFGHRSGQSVIRRAARGQIWRDERTVGSCTSLVTSRWPPKAAYFRNPFPSRSTYSPHVPAGSRLKSSRSERRYMQRVVQWRP